MHSFQPVATGFNCLARRLIAGRHGGQQRFLVFMKENPCINHQSDKSPMSTLEKIKRGAQVNGILPNQSVNIIDDKWHGPNILEPPVSG